jgi:hypothetical protein
LAVFQRFFEAITERCVTAGLVWGQELFIDSTDVTANAPIDSLRPRFAVEAHLARLFDERDGADGDGSGGDSGPARLPVALTDEARADLTDRTANRHDWIGAAGRPDRARTSGSYRRTADFRASPTDPDASPLRPSGRGVRLGYRDHYVVDGGKARILLTALVTPADVQDNRPAIDLLWRARFRWKPRPRQVAGGSTYGTVENIAAIEGQRMRAYVPLSEAGQRPGLFRDHAFVHDAAADTCRCPGGASRRVLSQSNAARRRMYQAPARACAACTLRERCTTSPRGRRVSRSLDEGCIERVRGYHDTEPYAKAMRKRKVWVEPLFAEAKDWHGLRRFRLRGREQVNGAARLIAAGQNLKRPLNRRGWGRRPWPSGAPGAAFPALLPVAASPR